jgi:hypothetical protein
MDNYLKYRGIVNIKKGDKFKFISHKILQTKMYFNGLQCQNATIRRKSYITMLQKVPPASWEDLECNELVFSMRSIGESQQICN